MEKFNYLRRQSDSIGLAPGIRIRIKVKSWIRIRIEITTYSINELITVHNTVPVPVYNLLE